MKQETLKFFDDIYLTEIGMFIFMIVFLMVVAWVYRSSSKEMYSYLEKMPLEEDSHE